MDVSLGLTVSCRSGASGRAVGVVVFGKGAVSDVEDVVVAVLVVKLIEDAVFAVDFLVVIGLWFVSVGVVDFPNVEQF